MKKIRERIGGIVLTILSLALTVGVKTVFSACGPKDDGSWMNCHWAEQAVFGIGIALTVMSVLVLIFGGSRTGAGASLAAVPAAAIAAFTPAGLINLCMMTNMHCHSVTRPAVIVLSVLIAVTAAVNAAVIFRKTGRGQDK